MSVRFGLNAVLLSTSKNCMQFVEKTLLLLSGDGDAVMGGVRFGASG